MRLFVAVNLPDAIREQVWRSAQPLRERRYPIRWVASDAIHITIKFLGEVAEHREEEVSQAIDKATTGVSPFMLRLSGYGAFPNPRRPKVIWVGCEPPAALAGLYEHLEGNLSRIGFTRESRAFHPHVTLGRVRREAKAGQLSGLRELFDRLEVENEFPVRSIELMQSRLSPSGAAYTVRESFGLAV